MRQQGGKDERGRRRGKKRGGGRHKQGARGGWLRGAIRGCRGRSGGKGVSRVPKERRALGDCVRQLFTTISLNRPRLLPVSAAFVSRKPPRPACIYVQRSRVLFIWPLLGCLRREPPPTPVRTSRSFLVRRIVRGTTAKARIYVVALT